MEAPSHSRQVEFEESVNVEIEDVPESAPSPIYLSVAAVLNYCKTKIINPYLRLLSIIGLRQLSTEHEPGDCLLFLNYCYTVHVIAALIIGYFLQYLACFRRDRGFYNILPPIETTKDGNSDKSDNDYEIDVNFYKSNEELENVERICHGPVLYSFIIPSCLHLVGYFYTMLIIRHTEDDQLPVLMERVFLSSTNLANGLINQKKLIKTLWLFVGITLLWTLLSFVTVNIMMLSSEITFKWIQREPEYVIIIAKILLMISTMWQDVIQATIISNYCLQTQLLITYAKFLHDKLLQYPIEPLEWIRHIENFKNMLKFINYKIAPSVCILTFMNLSYTLSGLIWLFNYDNTDKITIQLGVSSLNIFLWIFISLAPFIQASRLSNGCNTLRNVGQQFRTRPFVHQDTPNSELDSILLYTTSLKLSAKLFYAPINGQYLCLLFTFIGICVLVLGQCHYLNLA